MATIQGNENNFSLEYIRIHKLFLFLILFLLIGNEPRKRYLWPDLPEPSLWAHKLENFSPVFDIYIHELTLQQCNTDKRLSVCFYHGCFLGPVRRPRVSGCSLSGHLALTSRRPTGNRHTTGQWVWHCFATFCDMWSSKELQLMPFGSLQF